MKGRPRPLLLPSDRAVTRPAETPCSSAPRTDYAELARVLEGAALLPPPPPSAALAAKLEDRSASDLRQAILAARQVRSVSVYVSFSEKVGLPLALLLAARPVRRPHILIAHHLTSPKKRALQQRIGWLRRFSRIVVVSAEQAAYLRDEAGVPPERVVMLPHGVDTRFWRPGVQGDDGVVSNDPYVLSVGRERRDYRVLLDAARALAPLPFVIVASSLWSRAGAAPAFSDLPANVRLRSGLSYRELRALYARAAAVAVPLEAGTRYAAGATGLLEGMAMTRPVVVTATPGLNGYVADGETALRPPAGDASALAAAIRRLTAEPGFAGTIAANGRRHVEAHHALDAYVETLAGVVRSLMETG